MSLSENLQDLHEAVAAQDGLIHDAEVQGDELCLHTSPAKLIELVQFLKSDVSAQVSQLMDITAVDNPGRALRFDAVYQFLSLKLNLRVRVKVGLNDDTALPSVEPLFPSAGWYEREVWDMYGLFIDGNKDLRRILTDYGFQGHPLRKDFPLTGHTQVRYDAAEKRVVYEPVSLAQEYRSFDFLSPWEGMMDLPGDEKATGDKTNG